MTKTTTAQTNVGILIIGAGIAGLYTALRLAPRPVVIVTSGQIGTRAASSWAQGGLAAAIGPDDDPVHHIADTVAAGSGLVDEMAAKILCTDGPSHIQELINFGVPFDRSADGELKLGREAAHKRNRIVHVGGDEAGATIMRILMEQASAAQHITVHERTVAHSILTENNRAVGVAAWDVEHQRAHIFTAQETVLATGGSGGLFAVTTNPLTAIGQGFVMAHNAGATLRDIEFMQFHPTGLDIGRDPAPLATEALRGDGASLHDTHGRAFMAALHPDGDLAPRDVVARGVAQAIAKTGHAFLDARASIGAAFKTRFPTVYTSCITAGIDPSIMPMPVAPAAHYHMGGVMTDYNGATTLAGLWAVGEVASTGVHGANRLASNSLLEALVFGSRCAEAMPAASPLGSYTVDISPPSLPVSPPTSISTMRQAMGNACGLLRSEAGLTSLQTDLGAMTPVTLGDAMALTAMDLIITASLARRESRGSHQRTDFPNMTAPLHSLITKGEISVVPAAKPPQQYAGVQNG